ncbi:hypothetical protein RND61_16645 [Streptomyces sp. TRM76323]|uniref:Secreted protein n=1 Tax=Streptomyces tamarix TaxID=3078565 RepID=A0ABU3QLN1_9ACTN|nr:hypothetical protein [Streptomyces tamarix]MDT9683678.1 hypothetical protein [Streptomyces tamarix]
MSVSVLSVPLVLFCVGNGGLRVERAASATVTVRSVNGDVHPGPARRPRAGQRRGSNGGAVGLPAAAGPYAGDADSGSGRVVSDVPRDPGSSRAVTAFSEKARTATWRSVPRTDPPSRSSYPVGE